jgi:cyclic nucleotide gated channel alpha 3
VKSVGYSDLFCLSKEDLWEVLREYPAVRVRLEAIAVKRLEKHKKSLYELVNLSRSKSTPGLVEPSTKTESFCSPINLKRHSTLPTTYLTKSGYDYKPYDRKFSINFKTKYPTIDETKVYKEVETLLSDINEVNNLSVSSDDNSYCDNNNNNKILMIQEIQRLRKRLSTVENENTKLTLKLNKHHIDLKSRIADVEMQNDSNDSDVVTTSDDFRV